MTNLDTKIEATIKAFTDKFSNPFNDLEEGEKVIAYSIDSVDVINFLSSFGRQIAEFTIESTKVEKKEIPRSLSGLLADIGDIIQIGAFNQALSQVETKQKELLG